MPLRALALPLVLLLAGSASPAERRLEGPAPAVVGSPVVGVAPRVVTSGTWSWPLHGPILRGFDPPDTPYGAGHRGIDIGAALGSTVRAPEGAVVTFAGRVGGQLFVTLDHGGGLSSTYSWLSTALVRKDDVVARGQPIGTSGQGHPGSLVPHLHLGVKLDGAYVDPMLYLGPMGVQDLIRLAPLAT